jgi:hypothetical protein
VVVVVRARSGCRIVPAAVAVQLKWVSGAAQKLLIWLLLLMMELLPQSTLQQQRTTTSSVQRNDVDLYPHLVTPAIRRTSPAIYLRRYSYRLVSQSHPHIIRHFHRIYQQPFCRSHPPFLQ